MGIEAITPVFNFDKPALFLIDGAATWPPDSRTAALEAASKLAVPGSVIVGPAPPHDVSESLHASGFDQVNIINHHQLSQIFRRTVPEFKMLVAIHTPQIGTGPRRVGGSCGGKSN